MRRILLNQDPAAGGSGNPTPATSIPLSDHEKALEKARMEEKRKLHADLTAAEQLAQEAQKALDKAQQEKADLAARLEAIQKSTKEGGILDPNKLIEEVTTKARTEMEAKFTQKLAESSNRVAALEEQNRQMALERVKREAVAAAGGEARLIMALVGGNTPEEIKASVAKAAEAFSTIEQETLARYGVKVPVTQTPQSAPPVVSTPALAGGTGKAQVPPTVALSSVRSMSMEEFRRNQSVIMDQVRAALSQGGQSASRS